MFIALVLVYEQNLFFLFSLRAIPLPISYIFSLCSWLQYFDYVGKVKKCSALLAIIEQLFFSRNKINTAMNFR